MGNIMFSLKNVRLPTFLNRYFLLQIQKAGTPYIMAIKKGIISPLFLCCCVIIDRFACHFDADALPKMWRF